MEDPEGQADVCCEGVYSKTFMAGTHAEWFWCRLLLFLITKKGVRSLKHLLLAEIVSGSFFHACALWLYFFLSAVCIDQKIFYTALNHAEQYF